MHISAYYNYASKHFYCGVFQKKKLKEEVNSKKRISMLFSYVYDD